MKKKLGVYICHCGGNISDYIDVEKVRAAVENEEGVFLAKTTMFACSDATQKEMVQDIETNDLDGLVVASCSPKLHLITFRAVTERAQLNKYNYVHANIREQGSWAHSDDKEGATEKAVQLVKAAVAKVRLSKSLEPIKIPSKKAVVIIGAGIAGMRAAIELAHMGCPVTLIERDHFTGGRVAQWDILFTSDQTGREIVSRLYNEINNSKNITLLTGAEVISNKGSIGNFRLQVKIKPRYIKGHFDDDKLKKVIAVCPVEVPDEYNFNVTNRKAIYQNPGQYPQYPVIDIKNCTRCGECEKVCDNIHFSLKEEVIEVEAGSILVATGFDPYIPQDGEFGYNENDNVITLPQFKRLIDLCHNDLLFNGKAIKSIAYIYCVGSRQSEGENKYCSRYCCTSAIHTSIQVKKNFKNVKNFHFTRGIRTYGKQELLYYESQKDGDIYLQSYEENPLMVSTENGKICVKINDILTDNREISVEPDLVVLVTGIVPRSDTSISQIFKLPGGRDRFFNEIHPKLRPVETVIDGITIAGTCQGPKNVTESLNSGLSAATKSFSLVNKGELELEPIIAEIDKNKCAWCGECEKACPFDAIRIVKQGDKDVAAINNSVCKGCGMCLPVCPVNAINLISYSDKEIESMIDSLAGKG